MAQYMPLPEGMCQSLKIRTNGVKIKKPAPMVPNIIAKVGALAAMIRAVRSWSPQAKAAKIPSDSENMSEKLSEEMACYDTVLMILPLVNKFSF